MFKIFVGNLSSITTADDVRSLFDRHAPVDDVALPLDAETGKPRGFAIVMIKDEQKARAALAALRGARLNGRTLVINQARKKGDPPPPRRQFRGKGPGGGRPGGGRGGPRPGGGGYSGGRGGGRPRTFRTRPSSRFGDEGGRGSTPSGDSPKPGA